MKQVILIHGGDSFNSYEEYLNSLKNWEVSKESFMPRHDWKTNIETVLGTNYEVLQPRMPNKQNAKYKEWKIWFERMIPFVQDEATLIGHSLGAMFLVKYLAEKNLTKRISSLHLVASPHNNTADIGDFKIPDDLSQVAKQSDKIFLYHSEDDPVVPLSELSLYQKAFPDAVVLTFSDRGHFIQKDFPELIDNIINS